MSFLVSEVHIDQALSDFAVAYGQDLSQVGIAEKIAPPLIVPKLSDYYWVGGKESFNIPDVKRAPNAVFPRINLTISKNRFSCDGYGVEVPVAREEVANADAAIQPEQMGVQLAVDTLRLNYERRVAALIQDTSTFTNTSALTGGNMWDTGTSNPVYDIQLAKDTIFGLVGRKPNLLILGRTVFSALRQHPDIIERVKYVQLGTMRNITEQMLAQVFDIDELVVPWALYNTAAEYYDPTTGKPTTTLSDVWGKVAIIAYVDPAGGSLQAKRVTPARTFVWGGSPAGGRFSVSTYYEPQRNANIIQCIDYTAEASIDINTLYQYTTVVS